MGAVLYVDDLALLAPTRAVLAAMLEVVVEYGARLNIKLSSDLDPQSPIHFACSLWGK